MIGDVVNAWRPEVLQCGHIEQIKVSGRNGGNHTEGNHCHRQQMIVVEESTNLQWLLAAAAQACAAFVQNRFVLHKRSVVFGANHNDFVIAQRVAILTVHH